LKPQDTLARLGGDQLAAVILSETDTDQITALANIVRRALSTPVTFNDIEIPLTASIGLALYDPMLHQKREDMLKDPRSRCVMRSVMAAIRSKSSVRPCGHAARTV